MIPPFSIDLIQLLDRIYPARPPNPAHSEREIWMAAGERRLVDRLLNLSNEEDNNVHLSTEGAASGPIADPTRSARTSN